MGIVTKQIYTCDIGGLTTEDPTGWVRFSLTATPLVSFLLKPPEPGAPEAMATGKPPDTAPVEYGTKQVVTCPEHAPQIQFLLNDALEKIREAAEGAAPSLMQA